MNEPHDMGVANWSQISQTVVTAIRGNGDNKLLMIPGDGWSGAITEADNYQYGYQDNFYNQNQQQAAYWHDETQRPQLLKWKPVPIVRLAWCRVHNGRFLPVRQSTQGIMMDPSTSPDLSFYGRMDDSLVFAVYQPATPAPIPGYQDTTSAPAYKGRGRFSF